MHTRFGPLLFIVFLTTCSGSPPSPGVSGTAQPSRAKRWQPSTLSDNTREQVLDASRDYFRCIQDELRRYRYQEREFRYETEALLRRCEHHLEPIRAIFADEGVDPRITRRYLKRKRTQAARHVLRILMSIEARQKAARRGE